MRSLICAFDRSTDMSIASQPAHICEFKARWDIWRTIERHFLKSADYVLLERKAHELLKAALTMDRLVAEAKDIANQFAGIVATPLMPEHVHGADILLGSTV